MEISKYHTTLASYFASKPHFFDGEAQKKPNIRKCSELPWHQTNAQLWDDVTETLCDLDFIQAKACAKLTYDLVRDFHFALDGLPEYQPEKEKERRKQERLDKYAQDLIACAEGKISCFNLEVPESIAPWTEEQIDAEINRIKSNPTRADRLNDLINFLGSEADNLNEYAHRFSKLTAQQTFNFFSSGYLKQISHPKIKSSQKIFFNACNSTIEDYTPYPLLKKLINSSSGTISCSMLYSGRNQVFTGNENGKICVWGLKTGKLELEFSADNQKICCLSLSTNGKVLITGSSDNKIRMWDVGNKVCQYIFAFPGTPLSIITSHDQKIIITGHDSEKGVIQVWDIEKRIFLGSIYSESAYTDISIHPGNKEFIASNFNQAIVYSMVTFEEIRVIEQGRNKTVYLPDGARVVHSSDLKIVELVSHNCLFKLRVDNYPNEQVYIYDYSITPDGKYLIGMDGYGLIFLWEIYSGRNVKYFRYPDLDKCGSVDISIFISMDASYAVTVDDENIRVWNLMNGRDKRNTTGVEYIYDIENKSVDLIDQFVVTALHNTINLWEITQKKYYKSINNDGDNITSIAADATGRIAIFGLGKRETSIVWDLETERKISEYGGCGTASSIQFSPDNSTLAMCHTSAICNLDNLTREKDIIGIDGGFGRFSPDGKLFISGYKYRNALELWDCATGDQCKAFSYDNSHFNFVCFSNDGRYIYSSNRNKKLITWDASSGKPVSVSEIEKEVNFLCESSDGQYIFLSCQDRSIRIWHKAKKEIFGLFFLRTQPTSICTRMNKLYTSEYGRDLIAIEVENIEFTYPIITAVRLWNFDKENYRKGYLDSNFTYLCQHCNSRNTLNREILDCIEGICKIHKIGINDSPCLKLPAKAWEHPGLLSECPKCGKQLKFNPFIAGGEL